MKSILKLSILASLFSVIAGNLMAADNAGPSFITGTKGPVASDRIRVKRTCDIGPLAMSVAVCPKDDICIENGSIQNGQSQDFVITDDISYSIKGFNFTAGDIFSPCRAFRGQEVEIYKGTARLGVENCFCRTTIK